MLTTFTSTGGKDEPDLTSGESPWLSGSAGGLVLKAFDDLALP